MERILGTGVLQHVNRSANVTDNTVLTKLGQEADRLVGLFNLGLHARPTGEKVQAAFRDLVLWLTQMIELSPECATHAYLACEHEILKFLRDINGQSSTDEGG